MKANINENGKLSVIAETPLESFALARWFEDWSEHIGESDGKGYAVFEAVTLKQKQQGSPPPPGIELFPPNSPLTPGYGNGEV